MDQYKKRKTKTPRWHPNKGNPGITPKPTSRSEHAASRLMSDYSF